MRLWHTHQLHDTGPGHSCGQQGVVRWCEPPILSCAQHIALNLKGSTLMLISISRMSIFHGCDIAILFPSAATRDCRQTDTRGKVNTNQVRSVHVWSRQIGPGPVRRRQFMSDQVKSPLRINGVPSLELVALKQENKSVPHVSQRQSPMSRQGSKDCKHIDHETS